MDALINLILRFIAAFLQTKLQPPYIFLHYYYYFIRIILSVLLLLLLLLLLLYHCAVIELPF